MAYFGRGERMDASCLQQQHVCETDDSNARTMSAIVLAHFTLSGFLFQFVLKDSFAFVYLEVAVGCESISCDLEPRNLMQFQLDTASKAENPKI